MEKSKEQENDEGKKELEEAYQGLEREAPGRIARVLRWMRNPKSRWVRLPVGILFIALSMLWFLPVVGLELLPLGLLLVAQDVPFLRKPVARMLIWLEKKWVLLRQLWRQRQEILREEKQAKTRSN